MAVKRRTLNFLPSVFRTDTNQKFLGSTLDQLISEPELQKLNGFVGRRFSQTFGISTNYIIESDQQRQNYQFEPAVVVRNQDQAVELYSDYNDLINKISYYGGITDNHQRLFEQEFYSYDPQIDLDKFVNYSQYYWLPTGPEVITVGGSSQFLGNVYFFQQVNNDYITNLTGTELNPDITLYRGNNYIFNIDTGLGRLWIQSEPGESGKKLYAPNKSSREILGVSNNGTNFISFTVPSRDAQEHFLRKEYIDHVDYVISEPFSTIDNSIWDFGIPTSSTDYQIIETTVFNLRTPPTGDLPVTATTLPVYNQFLRENGVWNSDISSASFERNYTINITSSGIYTITGSCDNVGFVYIDGQQVLNIPGFAGTYTNTVSLEPGTRNIRVVGVNTGGPGSIAVTITIKQYTNLPLPGSGDTISGENFYPDGAYVVFDNASTDAFDWVDRNGRILLVPERRALYRMNIVKYPNVNLIHLEYVRPLSENTRLQVNKGLRRGTEYYFLNGNWTQVPNITAPLSTLFYQNDRTGVCGRINIVDRQPAVINVDMIIGSVNYTTPDGLVFSNGMKIMFDQSVFPEIYRDRTFIVEGVGTSIKLIEYDLLQIPELTASEALIPFDIRNFDATKYDEPYVGSPTPDYIVVNRSSQDLNAWSRVNRWFHIDVIKQGYEHNGYAVSLNQLSRAQRPIIEFKPNLQLYNHGRLYHRLIDLYFDDRSFLVKTGIEIPITDSAIQINGQGFIELKQQGLTLLQGQRVVFSNDRDPLVRFSVFTVEYLDQIESRRYSGVIAGLLTMRADSALVRGLTTNFINTLVVGCDIFSSNGDFIGRVAKINGETEFTLDRNAGFNFNNQPSFRFINPIVRLNQISSITIHDSVIVTAGANKGHSYYTTGLVYDMKWQRAQQKTKVNQEPLFDVVTENDVSISENTEYKASEFRGTKIFSYARGSGAVDPVLGFQLSYSGIGGFIGDINFINNYGSDTFDYQSGTLLEDKTALPVSVGFLRLMSGRTGFTLLNNWATVSESSKQFQLITAIYDGISSYFEIGVEPDQDINSLVADTNIKVFINNKLLIKSLNSTSPEYTYEFIDHRSAIRIRPDLVKAGDQIAIMFFARAQSGTGFYQIPYNLEFNPLNEEIVNVSFGQVRNHLQKIGQNTRGLQGNALGQNNLRDLNIRNRDGTLMQHSASLLPAMLFLVDPKLNFINSVDFARRDYTRFKNKFLELAVTHPDANPEDISGTVDLLIKSINEVKTAEFAWYYSDMLPYGDNYFSVRHRVINGTVLNYAYTANVSNDPSVLVYHNNRILVIERDYVINNTGGNNRVVSIVPGQNSTVTLATDDIIEIREYVTTNGSFIPDTPTKLGLYPKFTPSIFLDNTYRIPTQVVQGHDGSITPCFNDYRDQLLLEFETRIFNNIKASYTDTQFSINRQIPGKFRTTDYSLQEFNQVISAEFLKWVGASQVDYATNEFFTANDEFSWNYSRTQSYDGETLQGYWRGIYRYYYDTDRPHTHPWEMLGYSTKPNWWDQYYSWTVPEQRSFLIQSCKLGRTLAPNSPLFYTRVDATYARKDFDKIVPVDRQGFLISPQSVLAGGYNSATHSGNFAIGEHGPVESAWRRSSDYAFAVQRAMALMKPARYFGLLYNNGTYRRNNRLGQYLNIGVNRRNGINQYPINGEEINGQQQQSSSYINWIVGYLSSLGMEPIEYIRSKLDNLQVNLGYKMSGFSDKGYLTVYAEQFGPTSTSESVIIPDENYQLYLNKSVPINTAVYSAVIIERSSNGFTVTGYDLRYPYFTIIPSDGNGQFEEISVIDDSVILFSDFRNEKVIVPYGYEFTSKQQIVDFLISYERWLIASGFEFNNYDSTLGGVRDWRISAREFLTWAQQGWRENNILVVSPILDTLIISSSSAVVDNLDSRVNNTELLTANFSALRPTDLTILRNNGTTTLTTISGQTIAFARLNLVQFEHVLVFDNVTVFDDVIYKPELGNRQYRLRLIGSRTQNWDGELTPPGFIYNNGVVNVWQAFTDYKKGDIVEYKSRNYTAIQDVVGSEEFNFSSWSRLDTIVTSGILPNFSHNAQMLENVYDIDNQFVDENISKFSHGLIGFRSRPYLENLGFNQNSQLKFYQGYIKSKGTRNSINAISRGQFDQITGSIDIYEEWAARIGEYGAIDANPEINLVVDDTHYSSNPFILEFLDSDESASDANSIPIYERDLYDRPEVYQKKLFQNRFSFEPTTWSIELFGDSVMCGKAVQSAEYQFLVESQLGYSVIGGDMTSGSMTRSNNLVSGTIISFVATSKQPLEELYITLEPVLLVDFPNTVSDNGPVVPAGTVIPGERINFKATSPLDSELLIWTIEEVAANEQPLSRTRRVISSSTLTCLDDKVIGRIENPPDYLIYLGLNDEYDVSVTTRSAEGSGSSQLLNGLDGVNGVWPDDIEGQIILINHGLNDARFGTPLAVYRNNLRQMRKRLTSDKIIVWVTPTPVDRNNLLTDWSNTGTNDVGPYARVMKEVAQEFRDYVADCNKIENFVSYLDADGVHPTQQGYELMVNTVIVPTIKQAIRDRIRSARKYYEDDLQTAGYVSLDDVDAQVFDISDYANIPTEILAALTTGYRIWVAKDFDKDWQVYRAFLNSVLITDVVADIDNKIQLTTDVEHGLTVGEMIAIRSVSSLIDGFYQVLTAEALTFTLIATQAAYDELVEVGLADLSGQIFDFQPLRFASLEHVKAANPKHGWLSYDRVNNVQTVTDLIWVDEYGDKGIWAVFLPEITNYSYALRRDISNVTSYVYSVVARDCDSEQLVYDLRLGSNVMLCISSVDSEENDLYWTIEEPATNEYHKLVNANTEVTTTTIRDYNLVTPDYDFSLQKQETEIVDIESINNAYIFSRRSGRILARLDILDPAKGRILGTALQDLDFITSEDPANYKLTDQENALEELFWTGEQVGTYWWNLDKARFIHYEQQSIRYRAVNWGQLFPGSSIEVYEWIASDYVPSEHILLGLPGVPLYGNDTKFSSAVYVDPATNTFVDKYYFWVRGHDTVSSRAKKHSPLDLEDIIANPIKQDIPYMAVLRDNVVAVFNAGVYLDRTDSILHISSKRLKNNNIIHTDYKLIQEGNRLSKIPSRIENKLIDSLVGADHLERNVPDPALGYSRQFGTGIVPRQTLIANRLTARENLIKYVNSILAEYPIVDRVVDRANIYSDNLFAQDPPPPPAQPRYRVNISQEYTSTAARVLVSTQGIGIVVETIDPNEQLFVTFEIPDSTDPMAPAEIYEYDDSVARFSDIYAPGQTDGTFKKILVRQDETLNNYWALYERHLPLGADESSDNYSLRLVKRQTFDVTKYWNFVDYYYPGYNQKTPVNYVVDYFRDTMKLPLRDGDIVRVKNTTLQEQRNANRILFTSTETAGNFELYKFNADSTGQLVPELIGLGRGTIQFSSSLYEAAGFDIGAFDMPVNDYNANREMRYILQGIKQDLFIADLENEYPKLMYFLIDYILSEQVYIDWFFKTSFITVRHSVDGLLQAPTYIKDRQSLYQRYIEEVKPYRTKIRQYIYNYDNIDPAGMRITDFDLPAYWDADLKRFRSPSGEYPLIDIDKLALPQYRDWAENYKYHVENLEIAGEGFGYRACEDNENADPDLVILRTDQNTGQEAQGRLIVDSVKKGLNKVYVTNPGSNYTETPMAMVIGNGGTDVNLGDEIEYLVVSEGFNNRNKVRDFGLYNVTTGAVAYNTPRRGYTLHRIRRRDGKLVFSRNYDLVSASRPGHVGYTTEDFANDLNITTDDYIVVVHTFSDASGDRFSNNLYAAMYRCGASEEIFGSDAIIKQQSAYILVGLPGAGQGKGIEHYSGAQDYDVISWCSISFRVVRGYLVPLAMNPKFYQLSSVVSFPPLPEVGQRYKYGDISYEYNGISWRSLKQIARSLPGDKPHSYAVVVPRLANNLIRKIRTVIRFDRISYTTQITEWQTDTMFPAGTIVSYQGRAYLAQKDLQPSKKFNVFAVAEIGINLSPNDRNYRDGYFDNANDRIMAYYVQTNDNLIPKDLARLVSGIQSSATVYADDSDNNTILVGDTFASQAGISAGSIRITGGTFVNKLFSHAPEELIPGQIFDAVSIKVFEKPLDLLPAVTTTTSTTVLPTTTVPALVLLTIPDSITTVIERSDDAITTAGRVTIKLQGGLNGQAYTVILFPGLVPSGAGIVLSENSLIMYPGEETVVYFAATSPTQGGSVDQFVYKINIQLQGQPINSFTYIQQRNYPVVNNGLTVFLDWGNPSCYPGTGTNFYNLRDEP